MNFAQNIVEKWLVFSKYDPEQTRFDLLSQHYVMHQATELMAKITEFDPTCTVSAMYAKRVFEGICKSSKVSLSDLFTHPDVVAEARDMWQLFHSAEFDAVEMALLDKLNDMVMKVIPEAQIGERDIDAERETMLSGIENVTEELTKCKTEVYAAGGPIQSIDVFSTSIHVFPNISDCVISLESAKDGMYLCYIRNGDSADGWFGFFIKGNGTIVSINERVPEAFPGQHMASRNARHSDGKKYHLFPYGTMFSFGDYDYTGTATSHTIDTTKLEFFKCGADVYMPLLFAMILLSNKYVGYVPELERFKYIDALLPKNLEGGNEKALIVPQNSAVALKHREWHTTVAADDIRSGVLHKRFGLSEPHEFAVSSASFVASRTSDPKMKEIAEIQKLNQKLYVNCCELFTKMYAVGFEPDFDTMLTPRMPLIGGGKSSGNPMNDLPRNEFIADAETMDKIVYCMGRYQLAEYIRNAMFEEYKAFGGKEAVNEWFRNAIIRNRDHIIDICVETEKRGGGGTFDRSQHSVRLSSGDPMDMCGMDVFDTASKASGFASSSLIEKPFNKYAVDSYGRLDYNHQVCPTTGAKATVFFTFKPANWTELEYLFGEVPKVLKGWVAEGHRVAGNPLLSSTDAVTGVGTPFEYDEQERSGSRYVSRHSEEDSGHMLRPRRSFMFVIGFSKRGWKMEKEKRVGNTDEDKS